MHTAKFGLLEFQHQKKIFFILFPQAAKQSQFWSDLMVQSVEKRLWPTSLYRVSMQKLRSDLIKTLINELIL